MCQILTIDEVKLSEWYLASSYANFKSASWQPCQLVDPTIITPNDYGYQQTLVKFLDGNMQYVNLVKGEFVNGLGNPTLKSLDKYDLQQMIERYRRKLKETQEYIQRLESIRLD
jgi:hypothetical protein